MNIYEVSVSVKLSLPKKLIQVVQDKLPGILLSTDFLTFSELQAGINAAEAKNKVQQKYKYLLPYYRIKTSKANSIINNK